MPNPTKIVNCDCNHDYQDKTHGKGKRIANYAVKKDGYVCTVCGKIHANHAAKK